MPLLAPAAQLTRIAGVNQSLESASSIAGPALGALLLAFAELSDILLLDVAGALIACGSLAFVRIPNPPRSSTQRPALLREMRECATAIRNTRGMTQFFGSAILVAALCHFWIGIEVADAAFPVMCASIPFWLAGFWRPFGMHAEKFAPLLANHHLKDQKLLYSCPAAPDLQKAEAGRPTRRARRAARRKGAEGNEPSR